MWGTDWPHPSIAAAVMPDDGHLLDLFHDWTPDEKIAAKSWSTRRRACSETRGYSTRAQPSGVRRSCGRKRLL